MERKVKNFTTENTEKTLEVRAKKEPYHRGHREHREGLQGKLTPFLTRPFFCFTIGAFLGALCVLCGKALALSCHKAFFPVSSVFSVVKKIEQNSG